MAKSVKKPSKTTKKVAVPPEIVTFPGYIKFTKQVYIQLTQEKAVFFRLIGLLSAVIVILTVTSQYSVYTENAVGVQSVSSEVATGFMGKVLETGVLFATIVSGTLTTVLSESQQLLLSIVYVLSWLVTIWLLRHIFSGKRVSLRDGLYNSGAPLLSTILIALVAALQLMPLAIIVALLSVVSATGAVGGLVIVFASILVFAAAIVTIYWLVSTMFAAIIVSIPGTYPAAALRSGREIVAGKRLQILKRFLWLGLVTIVAYIAILVPVLFVDTLTGYALSWITVTVNIILGLCLFVYATTYVYMLYRRIIDEHTN